MKAQPVVVPVMMAHFGRRESIFPPAIVASGNKKATRSRGFGCV